MKANIQYFLMILFMDEVKQFKSLQLKSSHFLDTAELVREALIVAIDKFGSSDVNTYAPSFMVLQSVMNACGDLTEVVAFWFQAV